MVSTFLRAGVTLCDCPSYRVCQPPCITVDVTVTVSLSDWRSHCILETKVTVTVTVSVSTGVIALFVGIIVCDCDSVHHHPCGGWHYPVGIGTCAPVSFLVNVVLTV